MCTVKEILDRFIRPDWERMIDEWIYDELDRYILKRHLLDKATYNTIAEEINEKTHRLEVLQIQRRFKKAANRLFDYAAQK